MEVKDNVDVIQLAIQKLMEEMKMKKFDDRKETISPGCDDDSFITAAEDEEDRFLLARLLSQLESLKEDNKAKLPEPPAETKEPELHSSADIKVGTNNETGGGSREIGTEEIVKELKKVKKQNFITHCLLSVMIALTVAWQLSEVSLIMKVKNKLSHPFKSVGDLIHDVTKSTPQIEFESPRLPLKIPDLPHIDLPNSLGLNGGEE